MNCRHVAPPQSTMNTSNRDAELFISGSAGVLTHAFDVEFLAHEWAMGSGSDVGGDTRATENQTDTPHDASQPLSSAGVSRYSH
jgi:hypothetical protein